MEQQITVYDENNCKVGTTFSRRAKQLVIKNRAVWLDSTRTAIHLTPAKSKEVTAVDKASAINRSNDRIIDSVHDTLHDKAHASTITYDEKKLIRLAKKRVRDRRKLAIHTGIYAISLAIMIIFIDDTWYSYSFTAGLLMGVSLTWGVVFLRHVAMYFLPRIRIIRLFDIRRKDPVEAELDRLSRMKPERIAAEYEHL